jgi:hypothetical protein
MSVKDELHQLVEQLDSERASEAVDLLRRILQEPEHVPLSARMQPVAVSGTSFFADKPLTLTELARQQGVTPIADPDELIGDFWPIDESIDDFIAAVHTWRRDDRHA